MKTKVLGWGASLAMTAVLGLAGSASAVIFANGDTLNEFGAVQLGNVIPGNAGDILFVDENGAAPPGSLAREFLSIAGNTGAFSGYNGFSPVPALVRSFNSATIIGGFIPGAGGNTFLELPDSSILVEGALLNLNQNTIQIIGSPGSGLPIISDDLAPGEFIFRAMGLIQDIATGEIAIIDYDFTAQGLFVDPTDPSQTVIGSFSGTKLTVVGPPPQGVPEPASTIGLLALGALGAAGVIKQKKNSNLN